MANDLYARLKLDDADYNRKLWKAIQSTKDFDKQQKQMASSSASSMKSIMSVATKMSAALGIAFGAKEVFTKFINASQTTSDAFSTNFGAMKTTVNEFFYSLNSGDFSGFSLGLDTIYEKALRTQQALDELGNAKISYDYVVSDLDRKIAEKRVIATDTTLDSKSRKIALQEWKELIAKKKEYAGNLGDNRDWTLKNMLTEGSPLRTSSISQSDIDNILKIDISDEATRKALHSKYDMLYQEYKSKLNKTEKAEIGYLGGKYSDEKKYTNEYEAGNIASEYKEAILYNQLLNKYTDEQLVKTISLVSEQRNLLAGISNEERALNRVNKTINGGTETKGKSIVGNGISMPQEIDDELKEDYVALTLSLEREIAGLWANATAEVREKAIKKLTDMGGNGIDIPIMSEKKELPLPETKDFSKYVDGFNGIANVMGSLSGMTDNATASMLNWVSSTLSAIGMAIPAITALTLVKRKEADANAAAAATGAAASVASTPFVGWIMAGAAVASLVAAFASIPKFATGGIVGGTSFIGDSVLARVNSGEMILNKSQQANLFGMLNNGSTNGGNVQFVIRGENLVGILKNYSKKY